MEFETLNKYEEWAADGKWAMVADHFRAHNPKPHSRFQCIALLASAFTRDQATFDNLYGQLINSQLGVEDQVRVQLAKAARLRSQGGWSLAHDEAEAALTLAEQTNLCQLMRDAQFAKALCLAELGRPFLALDLFQQIANDEAVSHYRRSAAALNQAWLMWDLGAPEGIHQIFDLIPTEAKPRLQLMLDLLELKEGRVLITLGEEEFWGNQNEKASCAILLLEWLFLTGGEVSLLNPKGWFSEFCNATSDPVIRLAWDAFKSKAPMKDLPPGLEWRDQVDGTFLRALSRLKINDEEARQIYRDELDALLYQSSIQTPLIPRFDQLPYRDQVWCQRLRRELGGTNQSSSIARVQIENRRVNIIKGQERMPVDLAKSPTTLSLLRSLHGLAGRTHTKEFLHRSVSSGRYVATLHDGRLMKLVQRLNARIEPHLGVPVCVWRRDHLLELQVRVEVIDERP